jgi:serine/threonine protein kinase
MKLYRKAYVSQIIPLKILFREISLHKILKHPNIIRLYDHLEDRVKIYLILEYAEKGSLFDLMRKKIKLPEKDVWPIFTQICVGLNYLHMKNLLHRDLKPENLLINKDDVIKICDFGWSAQGTEQRVTFCGTLDYMSPEMLNNRQQTFKVDIWALGILLYEMLHGTPPYRAKNPRDMMRMVAEGRYTVGTHVSNNARQLISLLLQEDPENRPPIIEILKTQWVQQFSEQKLKPGWQVRHPEHGEGIIKENIGLVYTISFQSNDIELIENDLLRICTITDQTGEIVYEQSLSIQVKTKLDPEKANAKKSPLYNKLGIDTAGKAYLKPTVKSARNLRNSSVNNSPVVVNEPLESLEPTRKNMRLPRSPKVIEEVKRSQQLPSRRLVKHDFEGVNFSPEPTPVQSERRGGTPKSSFLQRFKKSND